MLKRLSIKNVALIERLDMDFDNGLNVLTGETGAGKSIIIDAVNLALGERASRELITTGAEKASVEAEFDIEGEEAVKSMLRQNELEDDGLIISRELSASITEPYHFSINDKGKIAVLVLCFDKGN